MKIYMDVKQVKVASTMAVTTSKQNKIITAFNLHAKYLQNVRPTDRKFPKAIFQTGKFDCATGENEFDSFEGECV